MIGKKFKGSCTEPFEEIISDEGKFAEIFNNFFMNLVPNLKIPNIHRCNVDFQKTDDPVLNAINKYKYHSIIVMINRKIEPRSIFSFKTVQYEDILKKNKKFKCFKGITRKRHSN